MAECAVIFDVDGVLLELTRDEEEIFFDALQRYVPTAELSRDWNSYRVRNDEDIIAEILSRNAQPLTMTQEVIDHYLATLKASTTRALPIAAAHHMLVALQGKATLTIATANLLSAAQHRLQQVAFWPYVARHAQGAEGGGHKSAILGRVLQKLNLAPSRVVYIGDNINDVVAGKNHGVHFIGFSESAERRKILQHAGATILSENHSQTLVLLNELLA